MAASEVPRAWPLPDESSSTASFDEEKDVASSSVSVEIYDTSDAVVTGTTALYENGKLRLIPVRLCFAMSHSYLHSSAC